MMDKAQTGRTAPDDMVVLTSSGVTVRTVLSERSVRWVDRSTHKLLFLMTDTEKDLLKIIRALQAEVLDLQSKNTKGPHGKNHAP